MPRRLTAALSSFAVAAALLSMPALAADLSFDDYWSEANHKQHKITEFSDFTEIITDDGTVYLFTKPNNPAHPGVIVRKLVNENGGTYFDTEGHSFGPDAVQPAFKVWMDDPWRGRPEQKPN